MDILDEMKKIEEKQLSQAIERLYYWQHGSSTSFTSMLYDMFCKADLMNKQRLFLAYPVEAKAWSMWYSSENPEDFFKSHGLGIGTF